MKFGQKTLPSSIKQRPGTEKLPVAVISSRKQKKALTWHLKMLLKIIPYTTIS